MKLLRNPLVVTLLAVAAIALLLYQLMPYVRWRPWPKKRPPATAVAVPPPAAAPVEHKVVSASVGASNKFTEAWLDLATIGREGDRWIEAPRKDPFKIRFIVGRSTNHPPASAVLTLSAVWHQDRSSLAVINKAIVSEGESISNYLIARIETTNVWVEGPNGRELVGFGSAVTKTNAGGSAPAPKIDTTKTTALKGGPAPQPPP